MPEIAIDATDALAAAAPLVPASHTVPGPPHGPAPETLGPPRDAANAGQGLLERLRAAHGSGDWLSVPGAYRGLDRLAPQAEASHPDLDSLILALRKALFPSNLPLL